MMRRCNLIADLTPAQIAAALGWDGAKAFQERFGDYLKRGFPAPDPMTGRFDPEAVEKWRRSRSPHLFPELTTAPPARNAEALANERRRRKWDMA
jgi:DNA-binding transcriptional regulator of glucitol operon